MELHQTFLPAKMHTIFSAFWLLICIEEKNNKDRKKKLSPNICDMKTCCTLLIPSNEMAGV